MATDWWEDEDDWYYDLSCDEKNIIKIFDHYLRIHESIYINKTFNFKVYEGSHSDLISIVIQGPIIYNYLNELSIRLEYFRVEYSDYLLDLDYTEEYVKDLFIRCLNKEDNRTKFLNKLK